MGRIDMLRANQRVILHFDLVMTPFPSDGPILPLSDFIAPLLQRIEAGKAVHIIDDERRVVRLSVGRKIRTTKKKSAIAMLFCLGDREKADPGFTNWTTGKVRVAERNAGETGGLCLHAVLSLEPDKDQLRYRMVIEDVTGFGRSIIQAFLRHEFRKISEDAGATFERANGNIIKTRPLVELVGHGSDLLKNSLASGRLLNVELVDYVTTNLGFDEAQYIKTARRDLRLSIAKSLPEGEGLTFIEKLQLFARKKGYEKMLIRWRDPSLQKPQNAQLDTDPAKSDASEALFVKSIEIDLDAPLAEVSEDLCDELVKKMKDLVE